MHDFHPIKGFTMAMKKDTGFTLIELLLALLIASILLTIGMPAMQTFVQNGRITLVTNELVAAINVARSNAIKEAAFACVCPSDDVNAATPACAASGSWEMGWIAFTDNTGNCIDASSGVLLKVWDGSELEPGQMAVRNSDPSITAQNFIRFNSRGATQLANGQSQRGVFSICDPRGVTTDAQGNSVARGVQLSITGSVRSTRIASQIDACPL